MMHSDNVLLKFIIKCCFLHTYSPMGNNVATLSMMYDSFMTTPCMTDKQAPFNTSRKTNCYQDCICIEDKIVAEMCRYLIGQMVSEFKLTKRVGTQIGHNVIIRTGLIPIDLI